MSRFERSILYLAVAVVIGVPLANAGMVRISSQGGLAGEMTRSPMPASGAWTALNPSNVAAASTAALTAYDRYIIQCADDTYLRFGTAASGQDATSSNGFLPAGAWLAFATDNTVLYVSALNKNVDSICYFIEAR